MMMLGLWWLKYNLHNMICNKPLKIVMSRWFILSYKRTVVLLINCFKDQKDYITDLEDQLSAMNTRVSHLQVSAAEAEKSMAQLSTANRNLEKQQKKVKVFQFFFLYMQIMQIRCWTLFYTRKNPNRRLTIIII